MGDLIDYRLIRLHNQQIKWSSSAKKEQMYINYLIKYLIMLTFNSEWNTMPQAQELSFNPSKFPNFHLLWFCQVFLEPLLSLYIDLRNYNAMESFFHNQTTLSVLVFLFLYISCPFFQHLIFNHELLSKLKRKKSPFLEMMVSIRY